jgi:lipopolysaccharide export system protein LptA
VRRRAAGLALALLVATHARAEEPKSAGEAVDRLGLRFTPNAELVITADVAEGTKTPTGQESVTFSKNVRASQGDMRLAADWLEAVYPKNASGRPDRITARGSVVMSQGANEARCSEASVDNVACTAECKSAGERASLRRGQDDVEANSIFFDLCKGTVRAVGDVLIRVRERPGETPPAPAPATPAQPGSGGG